MGVGVGVIHNDYEGQKYSMTSRVNGFINSAKTSLLCLENEIIHFWIWGQNLSKKLRIIIIYIVYYMTQTALGGKLYPVHFFGIKEIQAENCISCAVSDIIPGDALVLVANENSWTTVGVAVVQMFPVLA